VHSIKENAEALIVASKENGLELSADKTKYRVMSRDKNAGQSHNIKITVPLKGWKSSDIWGTTLANQNSIQGEIKSRMKSGNACYHSVHSLLSSSLLSKNLRIKMYITIILPVVLYGCETLVAYVEGGT